MSDVVSDVALTDRDFEELGRELVRAAAKRTEKVREQHPGLAHEEQFDGGAFTLKLRFHPRAENGTEPELYKEPFVCCVCVLEEDMVICRGPCCN